MGDLKMADSMMRVAGRGEDGLAKPFNLDDTGRVNINEVSQKVEGITLAENVEVVKNGSVLVPSLRKFEVLSDFRIGVFSTTNANIRLTYTPIVSGFLSSDETEVLFDRQKTETNKPLLSRKVEMKSDTLRLTLINYGETANFTVVLYPTKTTTQSVDAIKEYQTLDSALSIPASGQTLINLVNVRDAKSFALGIVNNDTQRFSVTVLPRHGGTALTTTAYGIEPILVNRPTSGGRIITKKYAVRTPVVDILIKNHTNKEATINVGIYKFNDTFGAQDYMNQKEIYGGTVDDRPNTFSVDLGVVYMATETREIWINTPNGWEVA